MKFIDTFLDRISMYRIMTYTLAWTLLCALALGVAGLISTSPIDLLFTASTMLSAGVFAHYILKRIYGAPANFESTLITMLLLICIVRPTSVVSELLMAAGLAAVAVLSKYVIAYKYRHVFNPVAIALVIYSLIGYGDASWWIANKYTTPIIIISAFLIARKIRRSEMVMIFILLSYVIVVAGELYSGTAPIDTLGVLWSHVISWPTIFFAGFMFTEPLSTPPTSATQRVYAVLAAALTNVSFNFGIIYSSPALALVLANIFSYIYSSKERYIMKLKEKILIAKDTYEFVFEKIGGISSKPGQYMEWTLLHQNADNRGEKRYFTMASAPNGDEVRLGVKFFDNGSTFKKALLAMNTGDTMYAIHPTGDFLLPTDKNKKIVWIAGGIGITPFISMLRYMQETGDRRDVVLFYANKTHEEIGYLDVLAIASGGFGVKCVTVLTDLTSISTDYHGERGFIDAAMLQRHIPDIKSCEYYISGPHGMVESYKGLLVNAGVGKGKIITDYFPGFI